MYTVESVPIRAACMQCTHGGRILGKTERDRFLRLLPFISSAEKDRRIFRSALFAHHPQYTYSFHNHFDIANPISSFISGNFYKLVCSSSTEILTYTLTVRALIVI